MLGQLRQRRLEAREQKASEQQLQNDAKLVKKSLKKATTKLVDEEAITEAIELPLLANVAPSVRSRRARKIKLYHNALMIN